jgi:hypothetical protein
VQPCARPVKDDADRVANGIPGRLADDPSDRRPDLSGEMFQRLTQPADVLNEQPANATQGRGVRAYSFSSEKTG